MDNNSIWLRDKQEISSQPLSSTINTEIAIIGAGITGLSTAAKLSKEGKKVVVIESNRIAQGTTGHSTGNLYTLVQPYYQQIIKKFSHEVASGIIQSRQLAIDDIERNVNHYAIPCNFTHRPSYIFTNIKNNINFLTQEIDFLQKHQSVIEVEEIPFHIPFLKAFKIDGHARFNPYRYALGLAKVVQENGGMIFENSPITKIEEGSTNKIYTENGLICAETLIIATHITKGFDRRQFFIGPYRSYAIAMDFKEDIEGHFWDMDTHHITSLHSLNRNNTIDTLMIAGNHHKTGQCHNTFEPVNRLEFYKKDHLKLSQDTSCVWSAQHYQTDDELAYIGKLKNKNTYIATGFFADGLVYGTVAANLISDQILKRKNPHIAIYNPNRFDLIKSQPKFMIENINVGLQYIKDYTKSSPLKSLEELKPGEGNLITLEGKKCAAYRSDNGKLHVVSAICTHLKCVVNWNNLEKSWDCPCHGSRFTPDGEVIEGPALTSLEKIDLPKDPTE